MYKPLELWVDHTRVRLFFYESFNNVIKRHHLSLSKTLKDECFPFIPVKTIQSISVYQRVKIAEATLQANNTGE